LASPAPPSHSSLSYPRGLYTTRTPKTGSHRTTQRHSTTSTWTGRKSDSWLVACSKRRRKCMLRTQFMIVMESDSMMMTAYAATWCSHSPFVKALLTPDDRMKPRPMFVPVETHLSTAFASAYRPYFWNSQSRLSSGHTWRVLSHREMQWKWKACCHVLV
jgi:hypothetical protein